MPDDIGASWPAYRLICENKLRVCELHNVSIDDVDLAIMALDAYQDAERRIQEKATKWPHLKR